MNLRILNVHLDVDGDGVVQVNNKRYEEGRLGDFSGPQRCVLSRANLSTQTVPVVLLSRKTLPVQSNAVGSSTKGFYHVDGSNKPLSEVMSYIFIHLNGWLIKSQDRHRLLKQRDFVMDLHHSLGFLVNSKKLQLVMTESDRGGSTVFPSEGFRSFGGNSLFSEGSSNTSTQISQTV